MRKGVIIKYIGDSLLLVSIVMAVSATVSAMCGFDDGFIPLLYSSIITSLAGAFPNIFVHGKKRIRRNEGYVIVLGSWLCCCLFGMIPYLMYGGEFTIINAMFETISGFTTTGASIITDIEALPKGLLFWRMATAWLGGVGIITIFSLFVSSSKRSDTTLNSVETSNIARGAERTGQRSFVHTTITVYIILTIAAAIVLNLSGMRIFDAVTHAMSACSTCGFSTRNNSIAYFDSFRIELTLTIFMLLASIRFTWLDAVVRRKEKGLAKARSEVIRAFLTSAGISIIVLTVGLTIRNGIGSIAGNLRVSVFQVASIFTTTGFATTDTNLWPGLCKAVMVAGSLFCGCSGSTSGGMKMDRAVASWKYLTHFIRKQKHPHLVAHVVVDGKTVSDERCSQILLFIVCYLGVILIGTILNAISGLDIRTAGTAAVACVGNVGPGLGEIGTMGGYSNLPAVTKCISVILMMIGRLEIFPIVFALKRE